MIQVSQEEYRGAPQLGSIIHFSHERESCLESSGGDPEVLDDADQAFLMNHIRKGTRGTYRTGWHRFQRFCKGYHVNPQLAPLPLIVKFVRHLFNSCVSCSVVRTAILAISEYHIIDAKTENTIGQYPLDTIAMKAFWQLKPPLPRYQGPMILILF